MNTRKYIESNRTKFSEYQKKYRETHKEKIKELQEKYNKQRRDERKKNPIKARQKDREKRLKRYGITEKEYNQILKKQDGRCSICKKQQDKKLVVDHNHETKKIRGLLCGNCNRGIGLLGDSKKQLKEAIKYLS